MHTCYVEFNPKDSISLRRSIDFFELIKSSKNQDEPPDEAQLANFLSDAEQSYFWNPTPQEQAAWSKEWFSTPIPIRHSPQMLLPEWQFGSMLEAFWQGDYALGSIQDNARQYVLTFSPNGYPFGGTGCMVAMLESFGHEVTGIEDGTGHTSFTPRTAFWQPKAKSWWQFWR
jgi:hypothetical protein